VVSPKLTQWQQQRDDKYGDHAVLRLRPASYSLHSTPHTDPLTDPQLSHARLSCPPAAVVDIVVVVVVVVVVAIVVVLLLVVVVVVVRFVRWTSTSANCF
jgi:hypothetical protein